VVLEAAFGPKFGLVNLRFGEKDSRHSESLGVPGQSTEFVKKNETVYAFC